MTKIQYIIDRAGSAAATGFAIGIGFFAAGTAVFFGLLIVSIIGRALGWIVVPGA